MTLDVSQLQGDLMRLLCRTARDKGRIEITNCDGSSCVMMSKEELDCLERALEILSSTQAGRVLHKTVEECAHMTAGLEPLPITNA